MQFTLYSRHELVTTPLGIDASIPVLPLVRVHQLYSFEHFYERGEKGHAKCQFSASKTNWTSQPPALPILLVLMTLSILIWFYCPNDK